MVCHSVNSHSIDPHNCNHLNHHNPITSFFIFVSDCSSVSATSRAVLLTVASLYLLVVIAALIQVGFEFIILSFTVTHLFFFHFLALSNFLCWRTPFFPCPETLFHCNGDCCSLYEHHSSFTIHYCDLPLIIPTFSEVSDILSDAFHACWKMFFTINKRTSCISISFWFWKCLLPRWIFSFGSLLVWNKYQRHSFFFFRAEVVHIASDHKERFDKIVKPLFFTFSFLVWIKTIMFFHFYFSNNRYFLSKLLFVFFLFFMKFANQFICIFQFFFSNIRAL